MASDTPVRFIMLESLMPTADPVFDICTTYLPQHVPCPRGSAPLNGVRVVDDSSLNPLVFRSVPFKEKFTADDICAFLNRSDLRFNTTRDMIWLFGCLVVWVFVIYNYIYI